MHVLGKKLEGRTSNVSRGGLCADLELAVKLGTEVEVELQLVFEHDEKSDALIMPARVVWCTTVDEGFQIGMCFKPLTAEKTRMMALFLRYLDDGGKPVKQPKGERSIDDQFG
ncbi:MAG: type pilus assembly PilZ [Myxococcales bacterium]|nr:type pilus assembly PilZ [Myxococcales bacterium]